MTRNEVIELIIEGLTDAEYRVKQQTIAKHKRVGMGIGALGGAGYTASGSVPVVRSSTMRGMLKGMYKEARYNGMDKKRARQVVKGVPAGVVGATSVVGGGVGAVAGRVLGSVTGRIHAAHKIRKMRKAAK